ncbi:MAG TPA: hypothetical protein VIK48_06750 [Candidatus Manganitrophaceae bacterium]
MTFLSFKKEVPFVLIAWFWIWGICPWSAASPAAFASETTHERHGHHEADDAHHASKGTEHSCSGSISYSKNDFEAGRDQSISAHDSSPSPGPAFRPDQIRPSFHQRAFLPKLFTEYYQLYSVYRI